MVRKPKAPKAPKVPYQRKRKLLARAEDDDLDEDPGVMFGPSKPRHFQGYRNQFSNSHFDFGRKRLVTAYKHEGDQDSAFNYVRAIAKRMQKPVVNAQNLKQVPKFPKKDTDEKVQIVVRRPDGRYKMDTAAIDLLPARKEYSERKPYVRVEHKKDRKDYKKRISKAESIAKLLEAGGRVI